MNMNKEFWNVLFEKEEWVCLAPTLRATKAYQLKTKTKRDTEFFSINPLEPNTTRLAKNVSSFRNFLVEMDGDDENNPISLEDQDRIIERSGLPWTTKLFTGNKSMHYIVSLETALDDQMQYDMYFKAIAEILRRTANELGIKGGIDEKCKDPGRMSRTPEGMRMLPFKALHELKEVKERVDLEPWFEEHEVWPHDFMPKKQPSYNAPDEVNLEATEEEKVDFVLKYLMKNQRYVQGNKNNYQFVFARMLKRTGLNEDQVRSIIIRELGEEDRRGPVKRAFTYKNDEPIYVWSREERRAWAERQQVIEETERKEQLRKEDKEDEILHNSINDYIRVGTKYYKEGDGELHLWSADILKADFGRHVVNQFPEANKYQSFCNVIDYETPVKRIGKNYNLFWPTGIVPVKGDWGTIYKLLCKVFKDVDSDQLKEGLEWLRVAYKTPEKILHALVVASQERETGKDSFVKFLRLLFGYKNTWFDTLDRFNTQFNASYCSKSIIAINEVTNPKYYSKTLIEKIKNYVTQKTVTREEKFGIPTEVDYYGKIVMLTNNINDFLDIEDEENRFWIRKMPALDKNGPDFDPDFDEKVEKEIPHFLYFLLNELKPLYESKQSRFWLPQSVTNNLALEKVKENTKSSLYFEIQNLFEEKFSNNKSMRDEGVIYFTSSSLMNLLPERVIQKVNLKDIRTCLQKEFKLEEKKRLKSDAFDNMAVKNSKLFELVVSKIYTHPTDEKELYGIDGDIFSK